MISNHICVLSCVHSALDNRIFYREARSLQRGGYEVTVVAVHDRDEIRDGIALRGLPRLNRLQRPLAWVLAARHVIALKPSVIHFHDPELLLIAPFLRLRTSARTVYDVHESNADFVTIKREIPIPLRWLISRSLRILEPRLASLNNGLVFADDAIAVAFERIDRPKTTLFNYPESSFIRQAVRTASRAEDGAPVVLHLGGHKEGRGVHLMIDAFSRVLLSRPSTKLFMVGPFSPPSLEQEIREEIESRGISHQITITGGVPFDRVGEYLAQATVGWVALEPVPKYEKNIPTKLFEYMAYGLPVVSSDLRPIRPYVKDNENGYLVESTDPDAHAQALLRVLDQPDKGAAMGELGRRLVECCYNWDEMEKRLLAFYDNVLSA
jgi:glycosyltransferase involved in cell wall biosynthesis